MKEKKQIRAEKENKIIYKDKTRYEGRREGYKIISVFWEEGLNKGEEVVIYESPLGLIEALVAIPEGQIASEKACQMSECFYKKNEKDNKAFWDYIKNKEKKQ